jgi:hypothetical protein
MINSLPSQMPQGKHAPQLNHYKLDRNSIKKVGQRIVTGTQQNIVKPNKIGTFKNPATQLINIQSHTKPNAYRPKYFINRKPLYIF